MRIVVLGTPAGQGSKRHVGHGVMIESSKKTRPWREHVHTATLDALNGAPRLEGPIGVRVVFFFDRPRGHYRTGRNAQMLRDDAPQFPSSRTTFDIDKLQRAIFDSLTSAGAWRDDSQVAHVTAEKLWCGDTSSPLITLDVPGVVIDVHQLELQAQRPRPQVSSEVIVSATRRIAARA